MKDSYPKLKTEARFWILLTVIVFSSIFTLFNFFWIRQSSIKEAKKNLDSLLERVEKDFTFENGNWNVNKYLADPLTPHPHGSSGFTKPLYIFTTEGFVIERTTPIEGFLDASDFKKIINLASPQNIQSETNEKWRVMTKEIRRNDEVLGVIFVSSYNPSEETNLVDQNLKANLDLLSSKVHVGESNNIDVSNIDIRNVHFNVSFEIVNNLNKVVLNNGRTPSFIDVSYIDFALKQKGVVVKNVKGEEFLAEFAPIKDDLGKTRGVAVSAQSLADINLALKNFLISSFILTALLAFPISLLIERLTRHLVKKEEEDKKRVIPKSIIFDKSKSELTIDNSKYLIPYSSNQYYLCDAIFLNPKRRWENDEILERMGSKSDLRNSRSVYDASIALNKKFSFEIVKYQNKTYTLNPILLNSLNYKK